GQAEHPRHRRRRVHRVARGPGVARARLQRDRRRQLLRLLRPLVEGDEPQEHPGPDRGRGDRHHRRRGHRPARRAGEAGRDPAPGGDGRRAPVDRAARVLRARKRRGHDAPAPGGGEAQGGQVPVREQLERVRQRGEGAVQRGRRGRGADQPVRGDEAGGGADLLHVLAPVQAAGRVPAVLHRVRPAAAARPGDPQVHAAHQPGRADPVLRRRLDEPRLHLRRGHRLGHPRRAGAVRTVPRLQPGRLGPGDAEAAHRGTRARDRQAGHHRPAARAARRRGAHVRGPHPLDGGTRLQAEGGAARGAQAVRRVVPRVRPPLHAARRGQGEEQLRV
ncbi:MAG: dTDP-glucose 4,6-dehydratase, partial [uncultured Phycisphaerae bacterium]